MNARELTGATGDASEVTVKPKEFRRSWEVRIFDPTHKEIIFTTGSLVEALYAASEELEEDIQKNK